MNTKIQKNIAISDSGFLFNPTTGESFSVNPIGLDIINLMREGRSESEICTTLLESYETESVMIERDLHDFIHMLRQHQLLENNDGEDH
ncbi:MAG TPA: PqqD family protein [Bacteroidales bacterium]|mgnify:CR=1 FL=1|nr:PqqD family protein [Bacteroidales bacterium]HPT01025.1 PqqD family protein [Bacteroidales bacterium]